MIDGSNTTYLKSIISDIVHAFIQPNATYTHTNQGAYDIKQNFSWCDNEKKNRNKNQEKKNILCFQSQSSHICYRISRVSFVCTAKRQQNKTKQNNKTNKKKQKTEICEYTLLPQLEQI